MTRDKSKIDHKNRTQGRTSRVRVEPRATDWSKDQMPMILEILEADVHVMSSAGEFKLISHGLHSPKKEKSKNRELN